MKTLLIIIVLLTSCGKINQLYDQVNSQISKLNDLSGNISLDGLLGFDALSFDFGQVSIGSSAVKKIHIDNLFLDNLSLNVDSTQIKYPIVLDSNSCINVKYQESCDIVLRLDGVKGIPQSVNQSIKINGISLSITGSLVVQPGTNGSPGEITADPKLPIPSANTISNEIKEQISLNPVDSFIKYGRLVSGLKYKANIYLTNISGQDILVDKILTQPMTGFSLSGCDMTIFNGYTCAITVWIDTTKMNLGTYSIPVLINKKGKTIQFEVKSFIKRIGK